MAAIPMPRHVLVFYDSVEKQSPMKNIVYMNFQVVMDHYGLICDYRDIRQPLPTVREMTAIQAIIITPADLPVPQARKYWGWILKQMADGRRIVALGTPNPGDRDQPDPELSRLLRTFYSRLGLKKGDQIIGNQGRLSFVYKDPKMVEFERKFNQFPPEYEHISVVDPRVKTYLIIKQQDKANSESAIITTGPAGGLVAGAISTESYLFWEDPITFQRQWYLNPFNFIRQALGLHGLPYPDPSTLNGLRVAFSHIDGDGFPGMSHLPGATDEEHPLCGAVIRDQVLKKIDFPVTVSIIVGQVDPKALGNKKLVRLARSIFALPNVEPASHSYSHPFYWDPNDDERKAYAHQYGIKIPGYHHDPAMEINYSMNYITHELAPPDKPCRVFLWSGDCKPMASDIARVKAMEAYNMNGGDTVIDDAHNSITGVASLYRKVGGQVQVHCGQANENILTNLWTAPIYGFRSIITTAKRTGSPRRLKPIDVYYHFYSAEYPSSLNALREVYKWAMSQETAPIFVSQYVQMIRDFLNVQIEIVGPGDFIIKNYGNSLTLRFDDEKKRPDLQHSQNILGYINTPQGLYVSLAPGRQQAHLIMINHEEQLANRAYIRKASGWIYDFMSRNGTVYLTYKGFDRHGQVELAGLKSNRSYKLTGSALDQEVTIKANAGGLLKLRHLRSGGIKIKAL